MTLETSLIDLALRNWRSNVDRAGKLFGHLSQEQLLQEAAPGKNRLIYLWGHLTAFNDALIPLRFRIQDSSGARLDVRVEPRSDCSNHLVRRGFENHLARDQSDSLDRILGCGSPTGCRSIARCLKRISCGSRIAIGSPLYSAERRISPITWDRQSSRRECKRRT